MQVIYNNKGKVVKVFPREVVSLRNSIIVNKLPTVTKGYALYVRDGLLAVEVDKDKLIAEKKALLLKYREDVEQVDLFGMERADYAEKKAACRTLVEELRELEAILK